MLKHCPNIYLYTYSSYRQMFNLCTDEPRSRYRKYRRDRYARLTAEEKRKYIENVSRKKTLKSTGVNRTACIDSNGQCFTPIPVLGKYSCYKKHTTRTYVLT